MKRILSMAVAFCIFAVLAGLLTVSAAGTTTEMASLSVWGIDTPVAGETPDYEAFLENTLTASFNKSKDDGIITVNGIKWSSFNQHDDISKTDTFCAGDNYSVLIALEVKDGYTVGSNTKCTVNGKQAYSMVVAGTNEVYLAFYFEETPYFVTESNVATGINVPIAGAKPCFDVELGNDECTVSEVRWYDVPQQRYITAQDEFEVAHQYRVEIDLVPAENYVFATDEEGNLEYTFGFAFDGFTYPGVVEGDKLSITASYTFNAIPITSIDISLDAPVPGYSANYIAYADSDACNVGEINWYDKTADEAIEPYSDYEFVQGHIYVATVDVFTVGEAIFDYEITATVNGLPANVGTVVYQPEEGGMTQYYNRDIAIRISYEFEPYEEKAFVSLEYDEYTHQMNCGYAVPVIDAENLEDYVYYIAFYDGGNRYIKTVSKKMEFLSDAFVEMIPDDAKKCRVMMWNKKTLSPVCESVDMAIPESELL